MKSYRVTKFKVLLYLNLKSDKLPSLIIKSYLKFASIIDQPVWEPKVDNCDFGYEGSEEVADQEVADFVEPGFPDFDEPSHPRASTPVPHSTRRSMKNRNVISFCF